MISKRMPRKQKVLWEKTFKVKKMETRRNKLNIRDSEREDKRGKLIHTVKMGK